MDDAHERDLRALARAAGLERLLEIDPHAFAAAVRAAAALGERTARPDGFEAEPAHTCRFPARGPRA